MPDGRAVILQAAEQIVHERGADSLTMGGICAAANVSPDALGELFAERQDVLFALSEDLTAQVGRLMSDAYRREGEWLEGVRAALNALLAFLDTRPQLARFLIVDSLSGDPAIRSYRGYVLAKLGDALEVDRPGAIGQPPSPWGAAAIVGACISVLHGRLVEEPVPPLRGMAGALMAVVVLPYLDTEAARRELSCAPRPWPVQPGGGRS